MLLSLDAPCVVVVVEVVPVEDVPSTVIVTASIDPVFSLVDTEIITHVMETTSEFAVSVFEEILKAS